MKQFFTLVALLVVTLTSTFSQAFNTTLRDQLTYPQSLNDIWGYVAPDGTEYALVGTRTGLSIVSLADPDDIEELFFIPGDASTWRDMKTYEDHAYVTTDTGDDGLLIVDLSNLPNSAPFEYQNILDANGDALTVAHNIYIDITTGIAYISGGNYNNGGMVLYDVATTPGQPILIDNAPNIYSHDVYVQDGLMYASEIFVGRLAIYDVADPLNISLIGTRETPFAFTHNAWTNAAGDFVFTTDERGDAPTAAYDITDPSNPVLVDEFRPNRSVGEGVIPHNTHVLNDYLIISHYTDGLEIVDASNPASMVEVAYYDTWAGGSGGFNGCWGAYPFLPSGLVLATDISNGLFVIEVDYQRAVQLNGTVTDATTGAAINNVSVTINSAEEAADQTDAAGFYNAGQVEAGSFNVTFVAAGYDVRVESVTLVPGETVVLDVELIALVETSYSGTVTNALDGTPIEGARVLIEGFNGSFNRLTDANGNVTVSSIFTADYSVYAGKWGFENAGVDVTVAENGTFTIQLLPGYRDGFIVNQGWDTDQGNASSGNWERGIPNGTTTDSGQSNPGEDSGLAGDVGNRAYVTGNDPNGGVGQDDIDGGTVTLTSPVIDLALLETNNVVIGYDYWFFNGGGDNNFDDDDMQVFLDNGSNRVLVRTYEASDNQTVQSAWTADSFLLSDVNIDITNELRLIVEASDNDEGHLVEGGLDNFYVIPVVVSSTESVAVVGLEVDIFPNPTTAYFTVNYNLSQLAGQHSTLEVVDLQGRLISSLVLAESARVGSLNIGKELTAGSYFLRLNVDGQTVYTTKVVKQ